MQSTGREREKPTPSMYNTQLCGSYGGRDHFGKEGLLQLWFLFCFVFPPVLMYSVNNTR